ncbi:MAG TPA: hypothetical protein VFF04_04825 [Candidatus Babeliales bacterium]|nr:hypothetical protein [Candidatus Babeliales bacterium]
MNEAKKIIYTLLLLVSIGTMRDISSCSHYCHQEPIEAQIINTIAGITLMSSLIYFLRTSIEMIKIENAARIKWYKVMACIKQDQIDFGDIDDDIDD